MIQFADAARDRGVRRLGGIIAESRFTPEYFQRVDEQDDSVFYETPRLVVHIDDGAIAAIGQFFKQQIPENSEVLDFMSSWRSHWPAGHPKKRMIGLGMNDVELRENPDLDGYVVHDVNANTILPFEN